MADKYAANGLKNKYGIREPSKIVQGTLIFFGFEEQEETVSFGFAEHIKKLIIKFRDGFIQ